MKKYGFAGMGIGAIAFLLLAGCQQNDPSGPSDNKMDPKARVKQQHETCAEVLHLSLDQVECPRIGVAKAALPRPGEEVCGKDGMSYASYCGAVEAGVEVAYGGKCIPEPDTCGRGRGIVLPDPGNDCVCPMDYDPVCGENGVTYGNACGASCAKVKVAHKGECDGVRKGPIEPIIMPMPDPDTGCKPIDPIVTPIDPIVTPIDPIEPDPVGPINPGDPEPGWGCIALWDPVCGANGATYGNECEAMVRKVEIAHKGACEGPK